MTIGYSKEVLYHFSCSECKKWWTAEAAADFLGFEDPPAYTPTVLHIALVSDL